MAFWAFRIFVHVRTTPQCLPPVMRASNTLLQSGNTSAKKTIGSKNEQPTTHPQSSQPQPPLYPPPSPPCSSGSHQQHYPSSPSHPQPSAPPQRSYSSTHLPSTGSTQHFSDCCAYRLALACSIRSTPDQSAASPELACKPSMTRTAAVAPASSAHEACTAADAASASSSSWGWKWDLYDRQMYAHGGVLDEMVGLALVR